DAAVDRIADKGFNPEFGARPVKRVIQREVLNELSKAVLSGKVNADRPVRIDVDADGNSLVFTN
ncbi:hypothetical protein, partial [Falsiporphyromonas endometrii]